MTDSPYVPFVNERLNPSNQFIFLLQCDRRFGKLFALGLVNVRLSLVSTLFSNGHFLWSFQYGECFYYFEPSDTDSEIFYL